MARISLNEALEGLQAQGFNYTYTSKENSYTFVKGDETKTIYTGGAVVRFYKEAFLGVNPSEKKKTTKTIKVTGPVEPMERLTTKEAMKAFSDLIQNENSPIGSMNYKFEESVSGHFQLVALPMIDEIRENTKSVQEA